MGLTLAEALGALARGQALVVAPALGDSYAGQSAATIAGLMAMLAVDEARRPQRDERAARALGRALGLEGAPLDQLLAMAESRLEARGLAAAEASTILQALAAWAVEGLLMPPPTPG